MLRRLQAQHHKPPSEVNSLHSLPPRSELVHVLGCRFRRLVCEFGPDPDDSVDATVLRRGLFTRRVQLHHADDVTTIQRQDQCSLRGRHECLTSMLVQWFVAFFKINFVFRCSRSAHTRGGLQVQVLDDVLCKQELENGESFHGARVQTFQMTVRVSYIRDDHGELENPSCLNQRTVQPSQRFSWASCVRIIYVCLQIQLAPSVRTFCWIVFSCVAPSCNACFFFAKNSWNFCPASRSPYLLASAFPTQPG